MLPAACAFHLSRPAHILCLRFDKSIFCPNYYDWGALFTLSWHRCSDLTSCLFPLGPAVLTSLPACSTLGPASRPHSSWSYVLKLVWFFCSPAWCLWPHPGAALPLPRKPACWTRCVTCLLPFQPGAWKVATWAWCAGRLVLYWAPVYPAPHEACSLGFRAHWWWSWPLLPFAAPSGWSLWMTVVLTALRGSPALS